MSSAGLVRTIVNLFEQQICQTVVARWVPSLVSDGPPPARRPRSPSPSTAASRPPPGPCTRCSRTSPPTSPGSSGSSASPSSTGPPAALTEEGEAVVTRARRIQAELEALAADVASLRRRGRRHGPPRLHRHHRPLARAARCSRPSTEHHPKVHVVVVDATTTSLLPQLDRRRPRPRRRQPPRRPHPELATEPLFDEDRILSRPPTTPSAQPDRGRAAPSWPSTPAARAQRHGVPRRARRRGRRRRRRAAGPGRGRRHAPARLAGLRGVRRRHAPGHRRPRRSTRADAPSAGHRRRRPRDPAPVGLARRRRGLLSAAPRPPCREPSWSSVVADAVSPSGPGIGDPVTALA